MDVSQDEQPEVQEAQGWFRRNRRGFLVCLFIVLIIVALALPAFLEAPYYPHVNRCPQNQMMINSAVQQYILEYGLKGQEEFVALFGTEQPDWSPVIVGKGLYLRHPPHCPAHPRSPWWKFKKLNDYSIADSDDADSPVYCNTCPDKHPYPMAGE
ncbi:hypothetical protein KQI84_09935 [bacterium]|nr:hypothetical protein [bacterium]